MPSLDPALWPLLHLQGDIEVYLMTSGLSQDNAHDYSATLLDMIAKSDAVKPSVRAAYTDLSDLDRPSPGDWLAVIDDSHCTVRLGGPGTLWQLAGQSDNPVCWWLEGVGSPYPKTMFRKATEAEIAKHLAATQSTP